ncbi:MAG: CobW family GTP-binding protein [Brevibacterium aurantiacum]|uniref:GTPase, G3E family n=1 Tax=Brevibacterium aurantiacum TaxID=273384 RepID=A0A2H1JLS5_BREAU|nr:CobW family GTP-binding protein [Brevibacterium aurantiacum]RCS92721.1 GTP-binding protein [Brevibacterium aurantiacum]SMX88485.1 GTPase, G3E family [Brevibacterium aurantiacum]
MNRKQSAGAVPVILLTGYLGAGKTSLLNHLLRHPDARIGVVVNDFGDLNIDAGLVVGQVDEPFSISGGCICCLDDDTSLEDALTALAKPRLRLDAIIVEASGFAEPLTLARMVTRMGHHPFHLGGVIDVVDATMHAATVDTETAPPMRYAATTLVLVNKLDQLPVADRDTAVAAIRERVHQRNPRLLVVGTSFGRLDPALIFDPGSGAERGGDGTRSGDSSTGDESAEPIQAELPIRELIRQAYAEAAQEGIDGEGESVPVHHHAQSVTITASGCADAGAVLDFLEDLPAGVYRVKGSILVDDRAGRRRYGLQAVGPNVYVSTVASQPTVAPQPTAVPQSRTAPQEESWDSALVVIGESFDEADVRAKLKAALRSDGGANGVERLRHYVRLHS